MEQRRRKGIVAAATLAAGLVWASAADAGAAPPRLERFEAVEPAMGTLFRITLYAPSAGEARAAFEAAFALARSLDARLSDYRADSELSRACRLPGPASEELTAVLIASLELARRTGGAFDPTLGPVTRLWRESRRSRKLPAPGELRAARRRTGWRRLSVDGRTGEIRCTTPDLALDLGGIAKGFAADRMLALLAARGLGSALVAASGDLAIGAPPPGRAGWEVGLPGGESLALAHCGVSTSGSAEQFVEIGGVRYSHILNPGTGLGLTGERAARAVTVIAPTATLADGLATVASVLSERAAGRLFRRYWPAARLKTTALVASHQ